MTEQLLSWHSWLTDISLAVSCGTWKTLCRCSLEVPLERLVWPMWAICKPAPLPIITWSAESTWSYRIQLINSGHHVMIGTTISYPECFKRKWGLSCHCSERFRRRGTLVHLVWAMKAIQSTMATFPTDLTLHNRWWGWVLRRNIPIVAVDSSISTLVANLAFWHNTSLWKTPWDGLEPWKPPRGGKDRLPENHHLPKELDIELEGWALAWRPKGDIGTVEGVGRISAPGLREQKKYDQSWPLWEPN